MVTIGINGFGRIGRLAFRIGVAKYLGEIKFGAINTSGSMSASGWAHLVNYDTMYRKYEYEVLGVDAPLRQDSAGQTSTTTPTLTPSPTTQQQILSTQTLITSDPTPTEAQILGAQTKETNKKIPIQTIIFFGLGILSLVIHKGII